MFEIDPPEGMSNKKAEDLTEWFRVRLTVLLRDNNTCQNCGYKERPGKQIDPDTGWFKESNLEVHHLTHRLAFKLNPKLAEELGYEVDDPVNLVTLCKDCHSNYHTGRGELTIQGQTYSEEKGGPKPNYAFLRKERRRLRKTNKHLKKPIPNYMVAILLQWLFVDMTKPDE